MKGTKSLSEIVVIKASNHLTLGTAGVHLSLAIEGKNMFIHYLFRIINTYVS